MMMRYPAMMALAAILVSLSSGCEGTGGIARTIGGVHVVYGDETIARPGYRFVDATTITFAKSRRGEIDDFASHFARKAGANVAQVRIIDESGNSIVASITALRSN